MKKLLSLLSVLTIIGTSVPTVIDYYPYQKNNIKDLSGLNWTGLNITKNKRDTQNNQTRHIFKTNGAEIPSEQQIKDRVKQLNPQVNINSINVTNITENSAIITITGFSGQKTLNFTVDKSISPSSVFIYQGKPITDFKKISLNNDNVEKTIVKFIEILLKNTLQKNKIRIKPNSINNEKTSAIIESTDQSVYTGGVSIKFVLVEMRLNKIITQTNLDEFQTENLSNPTEQQIKEKLKQQNPQLDITKIKVENITNSSATITPTDENVYIKNVNVKYTVSVKSLIWE